MRFEVFAVLACALLCCVGVFLPAGELAPKERSLIRNETISLYQLGGSKDSIREFLNRYRENTKRKIGTEVLGRVTPHLKGRVRAHARDTEDVIATLDSIRDEDLEKVGTIASVVVWAILGLNLVIAGLVIGADPRMRRGRGRAIAAIAAGVVVVGLAIAIHVVLRYAVDAANGELDYPLFALRAGAYLVPAAAIGSVAALVALQVTFSRAPRPADPGPAAV